MTELRPHTYLLLLELMWEGDYIRPSPQRDWVEQNFERLQLLLEKQAYAKVCEQFADEIQISPATLSKHYKATKKNKRWQRGKPRRQDR